MSLRSPLSRLVALLVALVAAGVVVVPVAAQAEARGDHASLLVRFRPGLSPRAQQAVIAEHGGDLGEAVGRTGFFEVLAPAVGVQKALAADPRVAVVEANRERAVAAVPNDPRYGSSQAAYLAPLHLPEAWDLSTGSDDLTLAIVDSGVTAVPELAGRLLPGRDFWNGDNDATDEFGHGTEVATVAAASTNNDKGMAGVAWKGRILPVKVLGEDGLGTDSKIAAGITWAADQGADVINLSLGAPSFSATLRAAVEYARSRDVIVVAAAGNKHSSQLTYPAGIDGVVAVTAVERNGVFSSYSNWGPWIDLAAPGDVLALGRDGVYRRVQGTSYAAPIVSAVALITRARYPAETADQIISRIRAGARDAGAIGLDEHYGFGIVDALGAVGGPKPPRTDDPMLLGREPDNSPARASAIPANDDVEGVLAPEGDVDWYTVDLPSAHWVNVTAENQQSQVIPEVVLFGADLSGLNETPVELEQGYRGYAYAPPGRLHVRVRYPDDDRVGALHYTVRVDAVPAPARMFHAVSQGTWATGSPSSIASGDVIGDTRPEIVVSLRHRVAVDSTTPDTGSVAIYGAPHLGPGEPEILTAPDGTEGTYGLALGDLDGDGDLDVTAATDAGLVVYEQAEGRLSPGRLVPLPGVRQVEVGDVDGDARPDLVATTTPGGLTWLRNMPGGTFSAERVTDDTMGDATLADVDGDGRNEIVALACDGPCSSVMVATRSAAGFTVSTFETTLTGTDPLRETGYHIGDDYHDPTRCAIGASDITGDGLADLFATCTDQNRVEVLRGRPGGGFFPALASEPELDGPRDLKALDLDGDGSQELAVLNRTSVSMVRADAAGRLTDHGFVELRGNDTLRFTFADFDQDGAPDVGTTNDGGLIRVIYRRPVDGEFHGWRAWVRDSEPAEGSATARPTAIPRITFVRPLDPAGADGTVTLTNVSNGAAVTVTSSYDPASNSILVRPAQPLQAGHAYALGYEQLFDTDGNRATSEPAIRFTVASTASSAGDPGDGPPDPTPPPPPVVARPARSGYWMVGADGAVYGFGDAAYHGRTDPEVGATVVDLEPTPSGDGYWLADSLGMVTARGDALWYGNVDAAALAKDERVTSLSATPTGRGYWLFTNLGRVVAKGDATWMGDMSRVRLNGPVLDSIPTPTGRGYYMVASDGGIFAFGDAAFTGSMGGARLNAPVQSLVPDPDGRGYWLVASDGGVFAFDADFRGSMGDRRLNRPITGMVPSGDGYLMVGEDGGLFNFSNRPFAGSLGGNPPAAPIVSVAALG